MTAMIYIIAVAENFFIPSFGDARKKRGEMMALEVAKRTFQMISKKKFCHKMKNFPYNKTDDIEFERKI